MIALIDILNAILEALGIIQVISGAIVEVKAILGLPAQEASVQEILDFSREDRFSIDLMEQQLLQILAKMDIQTESLTNQIGFPQQDNVPVVLPPHPPVTWPNPALPTDIAGAVWSFPGAGNGQDANDRLDQCYFWALNFAQMSGMMPSGYNPGWLYAGYWGSTYGTPSGVAALPALDFSTINASYATLLDWARANYAFVTWVDAGDGWVGTHDFDVSSPFTAVIALSPQEFELLKARNSIKSAPVWPGLAGVTLGTPLALSDGLTIPGPLHGVLISISAVAYPVSYYPFGAMKSYVKAGGIVFVDDNSQGEMAQLIGLDDNVVCPRTMLEADHALLRLTTGVVGSITPWVRN